MQRRLQEGEQEAEMVRCEGDLKEWRWFQMGCRERGKRDEDTRRTTDQPEHKK